MKKSKHEWKNTVGEAIEKKNKIKLVEQCTTSVPNSSGTSTNGDGLHYQKVNTKTKSIHQKLTSDPYTRKPIDEISNCNKQKTKTILMARNGMLECGSNFKGTMSQTCQDCNMMDDEHHRLNICTKQEDTNNANNHRKTNFHDTG